MTSLDEFYQEVGFKDDDDSPFLFKSGAKKDLGHFNVFNIAELTAKVAETKIMPYNRRAYYKISLINGRNRAEYADKVINIEKHALLFASPNIPYHYVPVDKNQSGYFCIFSESFLAPVQHSTLLDDLPIFKAGGYPVFELEPEQAEELKILFLKMSAELSSDYAFKYDLLRNYVFELIHYGQKLQPDLSTYYTHNASTRVASLFVELLERQFPIASTQQKLNLRTARDYADRLAIHVNHLNKVLKERTGKTTTDFIAGRMLQEAKILLKQTDWNISEISYSLGFEEVAHFSNFFKKQTQISPLAFRN